LFLEPKKILMLHTEQSGSWWWWWWWW